MIPTAITIILDLEKITLWWNQTIWLMKRSHSICSFEKSNYTNIYTLSVNQILLYFSINCKLAYSFYSRMYSANETRRKNLLASWTTAFQWLTLLLEKIPTVIKSNWRHLVLLHQRMLTFWQCCNLFYCCQLLSIPLNHHNNACFHRK